MTKKFFLSFVLIMLLSSVAVSADYYYERTSSTTYNGNSFEKEIEWRGRTSTGYSDDYDRYYDGPNRKCSSRDSRRASYNRYHGRGYNSNCARRYYYRTPSRYTTTYNRYHTSTYPSPRYSTTSSYNYRGRTITRTSRY